MRRECALSLLVVLACGCRPMTRVGLGEACDRASAALPRGDTIAASLLAASESDWRRDIDAGPMEFDEGGMPVTAKPGAGGVPPKARRARRFGLVVGSVLEVETQDVADVETERDRPVLGAIFSMGPRAGRFALELGYENTKVLGRYSHSGSEFSSVMESARLDLVLFMSRAGSRARFYLAGGVRTVWESVYLQGHFGNVDADLNNKADGFTGAAGFLFGRYDLRFELVDIDADEGDVHITKLTMTLRF